MATFNERKLNWTTRRRFPDTSGINFLVRISKFRKNFDKFPPHTQQGLRDKNSVLHTESYLCSKIESIQKLYFHGNFGENLSQSMVLENCIHCSSGCSRTINSFLCQKVHLEPPMPLCFVLHNCSHSLKDLLFLSSMICGTETGTRQVLGATNRDSKAYNVPFEAEL